MKLSRKLILTTLCTVLLPLVIVTTVCLWYTTGQFRGLYIDSAKGYLRAEAEKLSGYFAQRASEISTYANTPLFRTMTWQKIGPFLKKEMKRHHGNYEKLFLGTPNGDYYVTSGGNPAYGGLASFDNADPKAKLKSIATRNYWQYLVGNNFKAEARVFISDPIISYTTGVRQVVVGATILSGSGDRVLGMVAGTIQWSVIESLINDVRDQILKYFGRLAKVCLVTHDGIYVYHWDPAKSIHLKLDHNGKPILNEIGEKSTVRMKITDEPSLKLATAGRAMIQGQNGFAFYTDPVIHQEMAIIFAPVPSAKYAMAMVIPKTQILSPVKYLRWFFATISLASILLVMVIYSSVAKRITHPIETLSKAAKNLAKGKWQTHISPGGSDEVNDLTLAFDDMAHSLKQREADLKESEARFRTIFESTSDCILVWDETYNCLFANQAATHHLATGSDDISGKNMQDILVNTPDLMNSWIKDIEKVFENKKGLRTEDSVLINDNIFYYESVFSPIKNDNDEVVAVGMAYHDITQRKEAEEKIMQHMKKVTEANKRLEVLVSNTTEREKRMVQLKQEINDLLVSAGKEMKYKAPKDIEKRLN
ncbi:MAG: PAS domain S-box protein [Desulfobacterales bacterium]